MALEKLTVYYSGRVQGVGFRYTVKSLTAGFDVTGTIKNLDDGRVKLVVEGEKQELLEFQKAIRDSGLRRFIRNEDEKWEIADGELRGFKIVG